MSKNADAIRAMHDCIKTKRLEIKESEEKITAERDRLVRAIEGETNASRLVREILNTLGEIEAIRHEMTEHEYVISSFYRGIAELSTTDEETEA